MGAVFQCFSNGKIKVKLSLCLIKRHAMKAYWRVDVWLHAFLTSTLDGGEWSASLPGRFSPRESAAGTHWIGGWVGPRTGLDVVVKTKIPSPRLEPAIQLHISFHPFLKRHVALSTQKIAPASFIYVTHSLHISVNALPGGTY
jgi:hypothetical protein